MPDVFVAPDEKEDIVMHKRTPLPASPALTREPSQKSPQKTLVSEEISLSSASAKKTPPIDAQTPPVIPEEEATPVRGGIPLFTSFWQNPKGVTFDTQEANEHILLFLRQHFITNIPWLFVSVILLLAPLVVGYLFSLSNEPFTFLPSQFFAPLVMFYYLIILTNAFTNFLKWYYNISLITPQRMLDIELKDLVDKKITATKMSLVQDVSVQYSGTLRTIFNYGDILVQTAGPIDNFVVNATPKPEIVVRTIEELIGKGREAESGSGV